MAPTQQNAIRLAREWVLDCRWIEEADEIEEMSDLEIVRGVARHFCGGWRGFVIACWPPEVLPPDVLTGLLALCH